MGRDDLMGWQDGRTYAGPTWGVKWSHGIPKHNGLQVVEWSGVPVLRVECSQTDSKLLLFFGRDQDANITMTNIEI